MKNTQNIPEEAILLRSELVDCAASSAVVLNRPGTEPYVLLCGRTVRF
jgi:hypothetical protein